MSPIVNFSGGGYIPPGVYVDTNTSGVGNSTTAVGIGQTVICLVGSGLGYQTTTDNYTFYTTNSFALSKSGVDTDSVKVTQVQSGVTVTMSPGVGKVGDTQPAYAPPDYVLTTVGSITTLSLPSGTGTHRISTAAPGIQVSYQYTSNAYFGLQSFTTFPTLAAVYGSPLDVDGAIQSPISFAAKLAFDNGARLLYCIAPDTRTPPVGTTPPSIQEQFKAAYDQTLGHYDINVIVPVWPEVQNADKAVAYLGDLKTHLVAAETDNQPRLGFCGIGQLDTTVNPIDVAASVKYKRIVLFWPQAFTYFNSKLNQTVNIDGYYFAAAVAGALVAQALNRGLTNTSISGGIKGVAPSTGTTPVVYTGSLKDTWSGGGVSVAQVSRTGALVIRHGVTTDPSDVSTREISLVRGQDAIFGAISLKLESLDLIGDPITVDTPLDIQAIMVGILNQCQSLGFLINWANLAVVQGIGPSGDATLIDVSFSYQPIYPLNYIHVSFTLDLASGGLTATTAA